MVQHLKQNLENSINMYILSHENRTLFASEIHK